MEPSLLSEFKKHSRAKQSTISHWAKKPILDVQEDSGKRVTCIFITSQNGKGLGLRMWDFRFADLTLPNEGVKKEPRCFTDNEVQRIMANAPEPLSTITAVTAVLGLRIGETLALRRSDVDFAKHVIRIR